MISSTAKLPPSSLFLSSFSFKTQLGFLSTSSLPTAISKPNLFLSSVHLTRLRAEKSRKFGLQSVRKKRKGGNKLLQMDSDEDDDVDGGDEELELGLDGDDDEDGEGILVPFGEMKKWLEKKPRGFGEGKVYDTPIEDQLLQELEAQVETATKLKNDAVKANVQPKKKADEVVVMAGVRVRLTNLPKKKNVHRDLTAVFKMVPGLLSINPAVIGNKKTKDPICKGFAFVHFKTEKDAARFVEMFSSQSITFGKVQKQIKCEVVTSEDSDVEQSKPAPRPVGPRLNALKPVTVNYTVRGPKPTTEPAPKTSTDNSTDSQLTASAPGDQIVDSELDDSSLDTLEEETVSDEYDGSDVEILEPELENFTENLKNSGDYLDAQLTAAFGDEEVDSDLDDVTLDTLDETVSDEEYEGPDVEILGPEAENLKENLQTSSLSDLNGGDNNSIELPTELEPLADSSPSKQLVVKSKEEKVPRKKKAVKEMVEGTPKKKLTVKEKAPKAPKVPKLVIPGSSKRLKVKEKAVLSDVFSKYGLNPALASNEDNI